MKSTTRLSLLAGLAIALLATFGARVHAADMQYALTVGQNLVYDVTIRTEFPDRIDTQHGYLMYEPKTVNKGKGQTKLSYYWSIYWSETKNAQGSRGGGGGLPFFLRKEKGNLDKGSDFVIDRQGKIVSTEGLGGESQLPHALGSSYILLMQPVPVGAAKEWSTHRDLTIERYHTGNGQGNNVTEQIAAKETVTYTTGETTDGILTVQRKYNVESTEKIGTDPVIRISGDGDYQFNPKVGAIENYQMKLAQDVTMANASIKIPITVEARLLTADEVKKLQDDQAASEDKRKEEDAKRKEQDAKAGDNARLEAQNDTHDLPDGMAKTELLGGIQGGGPFTTVDPKHVPVLGFRVQTGDWMGHKRFRTFEPLYEKPTEHKDGETIVMARAGYAVGAISVNATDSVNSISITFMKQIDGGLDPKATYASPLYGQAAGTQRTVLTGKGRIVYGIYGRKGLNMDAIGLVTEAPPADEPAAEPAKEPAKAPINAPAKPATK